ncbi:MAG: hypothetical protein Q4C95_04785 [Planctomycetia bacterium]|nr:hypothetical protein [Planctomycetia bacterium]
MNEQMAPWEENNDFSDSGENIDSQNESFKTSDFSSEEELIPPEKAPLIDEIAMEYVGFWNRLVSQTNWEKGKVIQTWRQKLLDAGLPRSVYSDDAIAKRIGNVSGQHVGRLRRVYEQFGKSEQYPQLYWSHYQAALDWDDAQEWLKKASEEGLSVASMRIARWEKYGAPSDQKPKENEIVSAEQDEDINPYNDSNIDFVNIVDPEDSLKSSTRNDLSEETKDSSANGREKPKKDNNRSEGDRSNKSSQENKELAQYRGEDEEWTGSTQTTGDILNQINEMKALPDDLAEAFENLKIAILSHKLTKWSDVEAKLVLDYLLAMKAIILSQDS